MLDECLTCQREFVTPGLVGTVRRHADVAGGAAFEAGELTEAPLPATRLGYGHTGVTAF
jgi:hypothetical protein